MINRKHKRLLVSFGICLLCLFVAVSGARQKGPVRGGDRLDEVDPAAQTDLIMHDVGNVTFTLSNYGEAGNPNATPGFKGFEFPINSGSDFLFSAGVWIGADVNGQKFVTTATDGDNGTGELYPVHIGATPFANAGTDPDWFITSKAFDAFNDRFYVMGAKDIDDDGDWDIAADDLDEDGKPSKNWDGGRGLINFDDDNDGEVDEDGVEGPDSAPEFDDNGDGNCNYDPEPHIDEDPAGDISADYVDNDYDGFVDLEDPDLDGDCCPGLLDDDGDGLSDEDGVARGVQEYFAVLQDDIEDTYVSSPDGPHNPLNIIVSQRTYAFPEEYAADFILLDYRIRNVGPLPLKNVYIAMFSDPDIGAQGEGGDAASLDDFNYYDPARLMMVQYDDPNDDDGAGPGVFAIRVVKTPSALEDLRVTFANFERTSGGDPEFDADKYNLMSSGEIATPTEETGDWRMMMSFGDDANDGFEIKPGEELPITVAFIAGEDTSDVGLNAEWALAMYLNDFQGPSAPDAPVFEVDVYPDMVRLRWYPNAEASVDAITGEADFEGYYIERSEDNIHWQTLASFDRIDVLNPPFEWNNFNLGMPEDSIPLGDGEFQYYYEDTDLIPGKTYWYTVRAFDTGVVGAGVLTSGRTGNTQKVTIAPAVTSSDPTMSRKLSDVYVYPNPYRGSHAREQAGVERSGSRFYDRQIYFANLPETCIIRVFSLAGDHLATIQHSGATSQAAWNMITRHSQEIVSGIYYYTVEANGDFFIDKFVVIK
ncbi:hypothetical protein KKC97_08990 [bacterium]|nr:hypothetical protein [bacterium]MBU1637785.1 hypothetical protein [bacterium]